MSFAPPHKHALSQTERTRHVLGRRTLESTGAALVIAAGLVALDAGVSRATNCVNGVDEYACDTDVTDGSTADDICQVSGAQVTCELDRITGTDPASAFAIRSCGYGSYT